MPKKNMRKQRDSNFALKTTLLTGGMCVAFSAIRWAPVVWIVKQRRVRVCSDSSPPSTQRALFDPMINALRANDSVELLPHSQRGNTSVCRQLCRLNSFGTFRTLAHTSWARWGFWARIDRATSFLLGISLSKNGHFAVFINWLIKMDKLNGQTYRCRWMPCICWIHVAVDLSRRSIQFDGVSSAVPSTMRNPIVKWRRKKCSRLTSLLPRNYTPILVWWSRRPKQITTKTGSTTIDCSQKPKQGDLFRQISKSVTRNKPITAQCSITARTTKKK